MNKRPIIKRSNYKIISKWFLKLLFLKLEWVILYRWVSFSNSFQTRQKDWYVKNDVSSTLSLFKTRDLYETGAFYRIEKKYREPKLWSFEVCPFLVKYGFYKAISIVIWGSFWLFLIHFWPFFPENSGLDVLNGVFYMSTYDFHILQQKKS